MSNLKKVSAPNPEWDKFENSMRKIVSVPYSEVKAKLDAEKKVRSGKRTHKSKIAAFRAANAKG